MRISKGTHSVPYLESRKYDRLKYISGIYAPNCRVASPDSNSFSSPPTSSQTPNFDIPALIDIQFVGGKPEEIMPLVVELNNRQPQLPANLVSLRLA
ncbi:MAG: hypothetical protein Q7T96_09270 [Methylobacter sp.]|nr:hypothetical protein [Methylobacter sp.]